MSVNWIVSRNISMREAAEWVGFKFESLQYFSEETQKELKSKIVDSIIDDLDEEWSDKAVNIHGLPKKLSEVKRGIYVLCLDGGLCVKYDQGNSRVMYIGKGQIRNRIKTHLVKKLIPFFLKIPGLEFRFYMAEPKKTSPLSNEYFHDFENDLLTEFQRMFGAPNGSERWPIFNKNAGRTHKNKYRHKSGWKTPLNNTKAGYVWSLSPVEIKTKPKFQDN